MHEDARAAIEWTRTRLDEPQRALAAIGQESVRVTPLQVAMVSAAVANDGEIK